MTEIDVEPVERVDDEATVAGDAELPTGIDAPEYVLYGGKGGVGKTTMAAATGLSSAAGGDRTLVVSTDPAHSLSDTYEVDVPEEPTRIREDVPLFAAEIDPDATMADGVAGSDGGPFGGMGAMGGLGGMNGDDGGSGESIGSLLGGTMPGADEAAALQQLLEYLDDPRFDRVVIDTAPTGHTLRLLELPEILDTMLGRMLKLRQQFSGMMKGVSGLFGGTNDETSDVDLADFRRRIERLHDALRDPERTDFRVVLIPEEMSVVETERLIARLEEFDIPVRTLVVNRVLERLSDVADVDTEWIIEPDPEHCAFCARRWEVQQRSLRRASDLFRGRTVKRVPLLAGEVRGEDALRVVAACLD